MTITLAEICTCFDPHGSAERNEKGFITHGKTLGGCGLINRSVTFFCGMCEELSASVKVDSVCDDLSHLYYCDDCQKAYQLDAIDCNRKRCHNWPN